VPVERKERPQVTVPVGNAGPADHTDFDLRHDDDLESFRSRLFAVEGGQEDAEETTADQARTPISIARRERRPIAPPARQRREEAQAPAVKQTKPAVARREPAHQPQVQQERKAPRPTAVETVRVAPETPLREQARREPEPSVRGQARREPESASEFDVRDLINGDDTGLLDMTIEIAPDVPRACATCRNYRPSEQPGRGWCTNTWAFTHRQMVNEKDIACDSTIGCWWLPADEEVWLDEFEVAADATPRVDRLLARMNPERRAVGN
jgi:hypothetical protein